MNICRSCNIRDICIIHADMIKHFKSADITINSCVHLRAGSIKDNPTTVIPNPKEIDLITGKPVVDREKLNMLSNQARKEKKEAQEKDEKSKLKPVVKLTAEPLKTDHECVSCKCYTFKEDKMNCVICNAEICSNCATIDGESKKIVCEKCWLG